MGCLMMQLMHHSALGLLDRKILFYSSSFQLVAPRPYNERVIRSVFNAYLIITRSCIP